MFGFILVSCFIHSPVFFQFKLQSVYLKLKCLRSLFSFSLYSSSPPWGILFPLPACSFLFSEHPKFTTIHMEQCWDNYGFVHFNSYGFLCFMLKIPAYYSTNMAKLNNFLHNPCHICKKYRTPDDWNSLSAHWSAPLQLFLT